LATALAFGDPRSSCVRHATPLRGAPGLLQMTWRRVAWPSLSSLRTLPCARRRNAQPYGYAGVVVLRSSLSCAPSLLLIKSFMSLVIRFFSWLIAISRPSHSEVSGPCLP